MSLYVVKLTEDNVDDVLSRIQFAPAESSSNSYGNLSIKVQIADNDGFVHPLVMETPWMRAFVGVSSFEVTSRNKTTYNKNTLPVSFHNLDSDPFQKVYKTFCEKLDSKVVKMGVDNATEWLQMENPDEAVVRAFYTPKISYSKKKTGDINPRFPPKVQFKLPSFMNKDGSERFTTRVYDAEVPGKTFDNLKQDIKRGAQVKNLIECTGIWIVNKKFGVGWRSLQIKLKTPMQRPTYIFQEDSDSEDNQQGEGKRCS